MISHAPKGKSGSMGSFHHQRLAGGWVEAEEETAAWGGNITPLDRSDLPCG